MQPSAEITVQIEGIARLARGIYMYWGKQSAKVREGSVVVSLHTRLVQQGTPAGGVQHHLGIIHETPEHR
jgi:hypothetical protein